MDSADKNNAPVEAPVMPATPERAHLDLPENSMDQSLSLSQCPTPMEEYDPNSSNACSPFYSHPTTRTSFEQLKCSNLNVCETDLESGSKRFSSEHGGQKKDCKIWPSQTTLIRERRQYKKTRGCYPWNVMNKKQRLLFNITMLLLVIGLVVGVAVGISRAVGGTVYRGENSSSQIDK